MRCATWLLVGSIGCTPVPGSALDVPDFEPNGAAAPKVELHAAAHSPSHDRPPTERDAAVARCRVAGPSADTPAAVAAPPVDRACQKAPAATSRRLRKDAKARWHPTFGKRHVVVASACDRLADPIRELVFETSNGHGGSLHLVRLALAENGDHDLVWIDYGHYSGRPPADRADPWAADSTGRVTLRTGRVPAARAASLLSEVRAAAYLEVSEPEPPPGPEGTIRLGNVSLTSHDYHVAVQMIDADGYGIQRYFAGYEGSGTAQSEGVPLALVDDAMWTLLGDEGFVATLEQVADDDASVRALYDARLRAAAARGEDFGRWYLRERLLGLAAVLSPPQHVPLLLDVVGKDGDASIARSRVLALNAIAAITGFDRRYDRDGKARPVADVARETLRACTVDSEPAPGP